MIKSYLNFLKANAVRVAATVFLAMLVLLPFVAVPILKLRAKVPGLKDLQPKPELPAK